MAWISFCVLCGIDPDNTTLAGIGRSATKVQSVVRLSSDTDGEGPADDVVQLVIGDPGEVVLSLLPGGDIEVAEFAVIWRSSHEAVVVRRFDHREVISAGQPERIASSVRSLRSRRRQRFQRCVSCGTMTPPEWWFGDGHCESCAERNLGVVF